MLNIVNNVSAVLPNRDQYYVELIDLRLGRDDPPPGNRALRLGYWCDRGHLETIKATVDSALGSNISEEVRLLNERVEQLEESVRREQGLRYHAESEKRSAENKLRLFALATDEDSWNVLMDAITLLQRFKDGAKNNWNRNNPF